MQHSPLRVLVDHRAPIYLPLWHSAKPPLPVKVSNVYYFAYNVPVGWVPSQILMKSCVFQLWGVEVVSGNAVNWLECVGKGHQVTMKLVTRENDELVSSVSLHLPQPRVRFIILVYCYFILLCIAKDKEYSNNNIYVSFIYNCHYRFCVSCDCD